jgi:hypothetical protein
MDGSYPMQVKVENLLAQASERIVEAAWLLRQAGQDVRAQDLDEAMQYLKGAME